ncbi:hypothetical protein BJX70DRAFT_363335 [Aspergillus crustosus]
MQYKPQYGAWNNIISNTTVYFIMRLLYILPHLMSCSYTSVNRESATGSRTDNPLAVYRVSFGRTRVGGCGCGATMSLPGASVRLKRRNYETFVLNEMLIVSKSNSSRLYPCRKSQALEMGIMMCGCSYAYSIRYTTVQRTRYGGVFQQNNYNAAS